MTDLTMAVSKRDKLIRILEGAESEAATPIVNQFALSKLPKTKQTAKPGKTEPTLVALMITVFSLLVAFVVLAAAYIFSLDLIQVISLAVPTLAAVAVSLGIWLVRQTRRESVEVFRKTLDTPFSELINIHDFLRKSLQSLETRTTRYFHCITNTKVTSHFILMQIDAALSKRIAEIGTLLERGGQGNLLRAFELLQGSIMFQDGVVQGIGQTHVVPLSRVRETISQLMDELEAGIADIESEIGFIKSRYEQ